LRGLTQAACGAVSAKYCGDSQRSIMWLRQIAQLSTTISQAHKATYVGGAGGNKWESQGMVISRQHLHFLSSSTDSSSSVSRLCSPERLASTRIKQCPVTFLPTVSCPSTSRRPQVVAATDADPAPVQQRFPSQTKKSRWIEETRHHGRKPRQRPISQNHTPGGSTTLCAKTSRLHAGEANHRQ